MPTTIRTKMKKLLLFVFIFIAFSLSAQPPQKAFPLAGIDTLPVKFAYKWYHVSGGVAYRIECDTTSQFNSPLKRVLSADDASLASYNPGSEVSLVDSNYFYKEKYYWKVRTIFAADSSIWSSTDSFATRETIGLISPADLSYVTPASFFIAHIAGSSKYEFQLDTDPIFTNPIYIYNTVANYSNHLDKQSVMIPGTGYSPNTTYSWRVRAFNAVDSTEWSKTRTFTTLTYSNSVEQLDASILVYPNPASNKLFIDNSNASTIVISDMQGNELERINASSYYVLDVSSYSNGLYLLAIFEDNKMTAVRKFSVIK